MVLDDGLEERAGVTEPGSESGFGTRDSDHVREGVGSIVLSVGGGGVELRLLSCRAVGKEGPLVVDTGGDSEVTRDVNLGSIPDGGEEVLGGAIGIDVGEEVRWLDGIASGASFGEAVRAGD